MFLNKIILTRGLYTGKKKKWHHEHLTVHVNVLNDLDVHPAAFFSREQWNSQCQSAAHYDFCDIFWQIMFRWHVLISIQLDRKPLQFFLFTILCLKICMYKSDTELKQPIWKHFGKMLQIKLYLCNSDVPVPRKLLMKYTSKMNSIIDGGTN